MVRVKTLDLLREAVRLYTDAENATIDAVADPVVAGVWALRVERPGRAVLYLIAYGVGKRTAQEISDELEEVEFTAWPPRSRR